MSDDSYFSALSCLLDDGVALLIGTADQAGVPRAGRAWGIRPDDGRLRVVFGADDPVLLDNLHGGSVAVTGAEVRTFRSTQLKGRVTAVEEPDELDLAAADAHTGLLLAAIDETDGTGEAVTSRMLPRRMMTVVVDVSEGFDQTPGPDAGARLAEPT